MADGGGFSLCTIKLQDGNEKLSFREKPILLFIFMICSSFSSGLVPNSFYFRRRSLTRLLVCGCPPRMPFAGIFYLSAPPFLIRLPQKAKMQVAHSRSVPVRSPKQLRSRQRHWWRWPTGRNGPFRPKVADLLKIAEDPTQCEF